MVSKRGMFLFLCFKMRNIDIKDVFSNGHGSLIGHQCIIFIESVQKGVRRSRRATLLRRCYLQVGPLAGEQSRKHFPTLM